MFPAFRIVIVAAALIFGLGTESALSDNLTWNTFMGGGANEQVEDVAVNAFTGDVFVGGGSAGSWGSPVRPYTPPSEFGSGSDGFVAKYDADGNLVWNTFLGGGGFDAVTGLQTNALGTRLFVIGSTSAAWAETPIVPHIGGVDWFFAELDPATGALLWHTFSGRSTDDEAHDLVVTSDGIFGVGYSTLYTSVGTTNPSATLVRLDLAGNFLEAKGFGNLSGQHVATGVASDGSGGIVIVGTSSTAWQAGPTQPPVRPHSGFRDTFVVRQRITGSATSELDWYTFLGGVNGFDGASGIAIVFQDIYVSGYSSASWGSPLQPYAGDDDGWIAQLVTTNGALASHTFFGSTGRDRAEEIRLNTNATELLVVGASTASWGNPVLRPYTGNLDAFVARFDLDLNPTFVSFLGGPDLDAAYAIGVLPGDRAFIGGRSNASWSANDCAGCPLEPYTAYSDGFLARVPATVADLAVEKAVNQVSTVAGLPLRYTITVTNHGPDDVGSADVLDEIPTAFESANWTCAEAGGATCDNPNGSGDINETVNLPVGGSVTFVVDGTIDSGFTGSVVNTATVSADVSDPEPTNNSASAGSTVKRLTELRVTIDDVQAVALPGTMTTYSIFVTNDGPSDANVRLTDTFPADYQNPTWTCEIGGLPCIAGGSGDIDETFLLSPGEIAAYTVQGTISISATGVLSNTASVSSVDGQDFNLSNNSATDQTSVEAAADLVVAKSDGVTTVTAGGTTTYTIIASNGGPSATTGVALEDIFPAALTCSWTSVANNGATGNTNGSGASLSDTLSLPAGSGVTYDVDCNIDPGATGTISNTATISGPDFDPDLEDRSATDINGVDEAADLVIVKSDGRLLAAPGEQVIYAIAVTNLGGPSVVTGATVTDIFPPELQDVTWTCSESGGGTCQTAAGSGNINALVDLGVNQSVEFTISATIDPAATAGTLTNTATVSSAVADTNPANNSATDTTELVPVADLVVLKSDGRTAVTAGETTSYQILVSNTGPSDAPSANVSDAVPAELLGASWTCSASGGASCTAAGAGSINDPVSLPAGSTVTYTLEAEIDPDFVGDLSNTASAATTPAELDPITPNNSWTDSTEVFAGADLAISKSDFLDEVYAGESIQYTIEVTNAGPSDVSGALVSDSLPTALQNASWTCTASGGAACNAGAGTGSLSEIVSIPVGGSVVYKVSAKIFGGFSGTLSNTATVTADGVIDIDPDNDSATDTTEVKFFPRSTFRVTKDFADDNPGPVEVQISCNTGLILDQSKMITEAGFVEFVVTEYDLGELDCDIIEVVPGGYSSTYEAGFNEVGVGGVDDDEQGCHFTEVATGDFTCDIVNQPDPVEVRITKEWVFEGSTGPGDINTGYELTLYCDAEIVDGSNNCLHPAVDSPSGTNGNGTWCRTFSGNSSADFTAHVIPGYPASTCRVIEEVFDDAVEIDNGCGNLTIRAGQGDSCLVTNTVFFEGIPTLNPWALAMLAMLMLGIGLFGFRRFL